MCRTQGLPLRWFESDSGEVIEVRDICELNVAGGPLEQLPESACWEIGPSESALAGLQRRAEGGAGRRVALRSLFESTSDDSPPDTDPTQTRP